MPSVRVVLVEPKIEGNIGAVARAMRNFDVGDLVLVRPCPIGEEAQRRAMHGASILKAARIVADFEEAIVDADLVVGTSGVDTESDRKFVRIAVPPEDLASRVAPMDGTLALVLGREDSGLRQEELLRCDLLVTIPASSTYPILNVSHAATIILYALFRGAARKRTRLTASAIEKEKLHEALADLLEATDYPGHKRARTKVMFRRLLGRAVPSAWEFHALMGVMTRATKRIRRLEKRP